MAYNFFLSLAAFLLLSSCASTFVVVDYQENEFELSRRFPFKTFDSKIDLLIDDLVVQANPSKIDSMFIDRDVYKYQNNMIFYKAYILFDDESENELYVGINNSIKGSNKSLKVEMPLKNVKIYKKEQ